MGQVKLNSYDAKSCIRSDDYANGYEAGWNLLPRELPGRRRDQHAPSYAWPTKPIGPDSGEQTPGDKWLDGYDDGRADRMAHDAAERKRAAMAGGAPC